MINHQLCRNRRVGGLLNEVHNDKQMIGKAYESGTKKFQIKKYYTM